jgi:16S rRNA (guanine527-N7)-methyltransferase
MLLPISGYFPQITSVQLAQFDRLPDLYSEWNTRINVISRKDIDNFYERHVLHSLAIARFISFLPGAKIIDAGTGGGFPGIPLAILFPEVNFSLVDSVGKKIHVVQAIAGELGLQNIEAQHTRMETLSAGRFDFVVTRAVAPMPDLIHWTRRLLSNNNKHPLKNGIIALKGGELAAELQGLRCKLENISQWYDSEFFTTKKVVYWHP